MTPEEIEANSTAIMRMLSTLGATPEAAATWGATSGIERALERERGRQQPSPDQRAPPPSQPAWPDVANMLGTDLPPGRQPPGRQGAPLDAPPPRRSPEPLTLNAPGIGYSAPPPTNALMPQTPEEQAAVDRRNRVGNMAFEMSGLGPARRAGHAFSEGDILGGLGNAGMAMMPYRPLLGLGTFGAAMGGALGADLGLGRTSSANADAPPASAQPKSREEFFRTNRMQRGTLQEAVAAAERSVRESPAYRDVAEDRPRQAQAMIDRAARTARETYERGNSEDIIRREEARLGQQYTEYLTSFNAQRDRSAAVARAEAARDRELARDRRFADTHTGRIFDLAGGFAPGMVGGATGMLTRSARGAMGWGGAAGLFSAQVPLGYEALFAPVDNPRRRALEEYAAALPEGMPERERAIRDLQDINRYPRENPVRREAMEQAFDTGNLLKRSAFGLGEGMLGGHLGRELVRTPERVMEWWRGRQNRQPPGSSGPTGSSGAPANPQPPNPLPLPPLVDRRSRPNPDVQGGHWVPPGSPPRPGETERWVSPAGQNEIYRDSQDRWWRRIRGGPARQLPEGPPDTYRRISQTQEFFGGYPGANVG